MGGWRGGEGLREVSGESSEDTCGFKVIRISAKARFRFFFPRGTYLSLTTVW